MPPETLTHETRETAGGSAAAAPAWRSVRCYNRSEILPRLAPPEGEVLPQQRASPGVNIRLDIIPRSAFFMEGANLTPAMLIRYGIICQNTSLWKAMAKQWPQPRTYVLLDGGGTLAESGSSACSTTWERQRDKQDQHTLTGGRTGVGHECKQDPSLEEGIV